MTSILYLIPISVALGALALWAFFWSVKHRQYEDMESDAERILNAEDRPMTEAQKEALRE